MLITIGEDENKIVRDTDYEIGDYVTVYKNVRYKEMETTMYRPKWRDVPMLDECNLPAYPVKVDTRYKIVDIMVSAASGHIHYMLSASNDRTIFPSEHRGADEDEICRKVDNDDYETDPAVISSYQYTPKGDE